MKINNDTISNKLNTRWEISVPIFSNLIIIKELLVAIGIPFGILAIILIVITGGKIVNKQSLYALIFFGIFLLLSYAFIMILYKGKYEAGFVIDNKGITNYTQTKQAKRNRIINSLTIILGLITGKPSAAGAGLLAQSRQTVLIKWSSIKKIKTYPKQNAILIKGGFAEKIVVFCTCDNYNEIEAMIASRAGKL